MTIYMGEDGQVQIRRRGLAAIPTTLAKDDVVVVDRRFSADFPPSSIITGARLEIGTQDNSDLQLVQGHDFPDGYWYCHVDDTGGIRLYDRFEYAINGGKANALELVQPSADQQIYIHTKDENYNGVAQIQRWTMTTDRESVDLTVLGNEYRDNYSNGLISGQGELQCLWEYRHDPCDLAVPSSCELPHYFAQLLLRLTQGSSFDGRFYVYTDCENKRGQPAVWYDAACVVSNVSFEFAPGTPIVTVVQFVTTGPVTLHMGFPDGFILQEDDGKVLQENDSGILLEEPD